ncbi:MAG: acyl-ACP thioesterase domain-containing protein [Bacteroidota bacterium]
MYREDYQIRSYDVDWRKRLTLPALMRLVNEAAMGHVIQLKLSVFDLEPQNMGWVLLRLRLDVERLPTLGEKVQLTTAPTGFERAFTYRDYYLTDENGNTLATGSSTWVLFDVQKRRPLRIPDWIKASLEALPISTAPLERPSTKLTDWHSAAQTHEKLLPVSWFDLDFNQHVSNPHYVRLLLESLPEQLLDEATPRQLQLHYLQEARQGEQLLSCSQAVGQDHWQHQLARQGKPIAQAETTWNS